MKGALILLAILGLLGGAVCFAAPAKASAVLRRAVRYFDPVPTVDPEDAAGSGSATPAALAVQAPAVPGWRLGDRDASRAYEAGDFPGAAALWSASAGQAPPGDSMRMRSRADRANVYRLLSEGVPVAPDVDAARDEAEYRRRVDALKSPTAGSYLDVADFASAHGLRRHLAFLYERAFEKKSSGGDQEVQKKVSRLVQDRRKANATPPREVLDALIRELPSSEAADIAREETGQSGIGNTAKRGDGGGKAEDPVKLAEARRLSEKGNTEYKLAVPGTKEVNVHRRAALDAFTKARDLYEAIDRETGIQSHQHDVQELNRNIAELHKDLPIGK